MNTGASIAEDGTLITTPTIWGTDSETLGHSQPFENLLFRSNFQAKADYNRTFDKHRIGGALIYDMQSVNRNGRNNSQKNLSVLVNATYTYDDRYTLNAVFNRSGSAYLPDGDKFANYPAVSAAWIVSSLEFMPIRTLSYLHSPFPWIRIERIRAAAASSSVKTAPPSP